MLNKKSTYIIKMYQSCKTTKKQNCNIFYHTKYTKKGAHRRAKHVDTLPYSFFNQTD